MMPGRFASRKALRPQACLVRLTPTGYRPPRCSSDFGVGWRFSNSIFLQYVFSTSYGPDSGGNTLMLRYTFRLHDE